MPSYYDQDYLAHYGVIGMKWGVRHNPAKAAVKTAAKAGRIKKRIGRREGVAKWATRRGIELDNIVTRPLAQRSFTLAREANKSKHRQVAKGAKFLSAAIKEFGKQNVVTLDKSTVDYGRYLMDKMNEYNREVEMNSLRN